MISRLISGLHKLKFEPTAEDIADMLWLALQMHPDALEQVDSEIKPEIAEEAEQPHPIDGTDADETHLRDDNIVEGSIAAEEGLEQPVTGVGELHLDGRDDEHKELSPGSKPFKSPAASALPGALDLSRALRPLMRRVASRTRMVFDEKATAHAIAQQYLAGQDTWIPVEHPARERWLEVALVVDESRSMHIWQRTIMELQVLLERQGAFRDVRTWGLVADSDEQHIHLRAGIGLMADKRQMRDPAELIDARGRRLILVVSDCVSRVWRNGVVAKALLQWGCHGPLAIIQVLPSRMWSRTGLGLEVEAYMHAPLAGVPNRRLAYELGNHQLEAVVRKRGMPVPVVPLTRVPLHHWAHAVAGTESQWISGYLFAPRTKEPMPVLEEDKEPPVIEPPTAEQRIKRFRATASPTARELAGLLAAAPISLPVVRVVQHTLLPQAEQGHIAEVFLGGLLEQLPSVSTARHPDYVQYDFVAGVRDLLLDAMPIEESIQVLKEVSDFVATQYGNTLDFRALLADPASMEGKAIDEASKPFATVAAQILSRIGGDYATVAQHLEQAASAQRVPARLNGASGKEGLSVVERSLEDISAHGASDRGEDVPAEVVESPDYRQTIEASSDGVSVGGEAVSQTIKGYYNTFIGRDFYISSTSVDSRWAEWITWQLEGAGYTAVLPKRDFRPGSNFELQRERAIETAGRILLVLSHDYFDSNASIEMERALTLAERGRVSLLPVIVQQFNYDRLGPLRSIIYINLVGLDENAARKALLSGVRPDPEPVTEPPNFPGDSFSSRVEVSGGGETAIEAVPVFPEAESSTGDRGRGGTGSLPETEVFLVYAYEDHNLVNDLRKHLYVLERQGLIIGWSDIAPGVERSVEIDKHLETADIILVMMSADFLASDYPYMPVMQRALQRHEAGEAHVIPVILRPVYWENSPFYKLQMLPRGGKAVTLWDNRDVAMVDIVKGIQYIIRQLHNNPPDEVQFDPPFETEFEEVEPDPPFEAEFEEVEPDPPFEMELEEVEPDPPFEMELEEVEPDPPFETEFEEVESDPPFEAQPELPPFWNVPYARNPFFTGREEIIAVLHDGFFRSGITQPQAISGLGGIGKTQIAVEYAYRYSSSYRYVLWARADTRETLIADFSACAALLRLPAALDEDQVVIVRSFVRWFNTNSDWLLIIDNADDLGMVSDFLPANGRGHILLTTRAQATRRLAQQVFVGALSADAGAVFLLRRTGIVAHDAMQDDELEQARAISRVLGGLPLALDQAAAYIEETDISLSHYLQLYQEHSMELLQRRGSIVSDHPEPVATTWLLSFERVKQANPAAADLLRFCSFLAPDAIPIELITGSAAFNSPLSDIAGNAFKLETALGEIMKFSFLSRDHANNTFTMHRLVQIVFKDRMIAEEQGYWAERTVVAVNSVFPSGDFGTWEQCQRYLPHVYTCVNLINEYNLVSQEAARLCDRVGFYLYSIAQFAEAEVFIKHALSINRQAYNSEHPDTVSYLNNLGIIYLEQGKYAEAEPLLQQAVAGGQKVLHPSHPSLADYLNNLGELYLAQGKYDEAASFLEQALVQGERARPADHPILARCLSNVGKLYLLQGKYNYVEEILQHALAIDKKVLSADHPDLASILNIMGRLYWVQGKYEQAEPLLQRALAIDQKVLPSDHPDIARGLNNLGVFYFMEGKFDDAEVFMSRAVRLYERKLGVDHPFAKVARSNYGLVRDYLGQDEVEDMGGVLEMM